MRPIGKDVLRALWSPSIPIREPSSFKWFFHTPPSHHYQPYICQKEKARHFSGWVLFTKYFPPQFTSYRLTIDPNILLQLMEWLGWISENSWPQPCVTRCFLFTCFSSSNQPTNVCLLVLPLKPPWRGVVCLWWGGFSCLLPLCQTWTIWSSSTLSTAGRQLLLGQTAPPSVCCILHNQYNHTPSTRHRSAGNLLCVSVELLQTSPWPGFALAAGQAFLLIQVAHRWSSQVWRTLCYIVSASWPLCTILLLFQPSGHSLLLVCQAVLTYDLDMVMYSHSLTETLCNMLSQWQLFARTYLMRQCVTGPEFFRCHFFR